MTMRRALPLALAVAAMPTLARADEAPDLARYDCTRTDDGKTVAGDTLAASGFRIASRARFGNVNLMLADPKTSVRANCFLRSPPR